MRVQLLQKQSLYDWLRRTRLRFDSARFVFTELQRSQDVKGEVCLCQKYTSQM